MYPAECMDMLGTDADVVVYVDKQNNHFTQVFLILSDVKQLLNFMLLNVMLAVCFLISISYSYSNVFLFEQRKKHRITEPIRREKDKLL